MLGVVGNLSRDCIDGGPPRVGGGPYYAARALRALGRRGLIVAGCAPEDRRVLVGPVVRLGLPVAWRASESTAAFTIENDGGSRRLHVDSLGGTWPAEPLPRAVRHVHVAPLARGDFPPATLAVLARGRVLSLDGQGLVRPSRTGAIELDSDFDPTLLRYVSILKLAEVEAAVLVDGVDERALRTIGVPEIVVTLGGRGCVVYADGVAEHVPVREVQTRDPTGAGDEFAAAYLAARATGAVPVGAARIASSVVASLLP